MYRTAIDDLKGWSCRQNRKPLVLRGARQVGKTYLVRQFAGEHFGNIAERISFQQMSLPIYLVGQLPRLICTQNA